MDIQLVPTSGFCAGVRRAVEMAARAAEAGGPVYTAGPLIHNRQMVERLASMGVNPDWEGPPGTVIVRAHGLPPGELARIAAAGHRIVDATCPRVLHSQAAIRDAARSGSTVFLAGDPGHPETVGLAGQAPDRVRVVATVDGAESGETAGSAVLLAQTTFSRSLFEAIAAVLRRRMPGIVVLDTLCDATERRQEEARRFLASADMLVVVGGKDSANTARLAAIGAESGKPAVWVETEAELESEAFRGVGSVAVAAGASTPDWVTEGVVRRLKQISRQ